MKILEVVTDKISPFKTLIEVLKDMLSDANIDFISPKDDSNSNKDESDHDGDVSDDDVKSIDSNSKSKVKEKLSKTKDKTKDKSKSKDKVKEVKTKSKGKAKKDDSNGFEEIEEDELDEDATKTSKKISSGSKGGIKITAVDVTKTVLINVKLDGDKFLKFKCKKKKLTLGVNLGDMFKFLKTLNPEDTLTFDQEHDNKNFLHIKMESADNNEVDDCELKLLELPKEKMSIPDILFEAVVTINSQKFHKLCREMKSIADYVEIKCLKNKIEFSCRGDIGNRKKCYKTDNGSDRVNIQYARKDNNKPFIVQGIYELKYLVMFSKCASLCPCIEIYLKSDYPLILQYKVADLGRLLLCLSPIKENTIMNDKYEDDEYFSDEDVEMRK